MNFAALRRQLAARRPVRFPRASWCGTLAVVLMILPCVHCAIPETDTQIASTPDTLPQTIDNTNDNANGGASNAADDITRVQEGDSAFVHPGDVVQLIGQPADPGSGRTLNRRWTLIAGPALQLVQNEASALFTVPDMDDDYHLIFSFLDAELEPFPEVFTVVHVLDGAQQIDGDVPGLRSGVEAVITPNYVSAAGGSSVTLDGRGSSGGGQRVLNYYWVQIDGEPLEFDNPQSPVVTLALPEVEDDTHAVLQLFVMTTSSYDVDTAWIDVSAPVGTAGGGSTGEVSECAIDADCDDGAFCNGAEACVNHECQPGTSPCPQAYCREETDHCLACLSDAECDDGLFCNGTESCSGGACIPGTPACGAQTCDEAGDQCAECFTSADCTDGVFCNGAEVCQNNVCVPGAAPCPSAFCMEAESRCAECLTNTDCDDGVFCNGAESCQAGACQPGQPPCVFRACDEDAELCVACLENSDCNDGLFCNGEETCEAGICVPGRDACPGRMCNESNDLCVECLNSSDCDDGLFCNGVETCAFGTCVAGTQPCLAQGLQCDEAADDCTFQIAGQVVAVGGTVTNRLGQPMSGIPLILTGSGDFVNDDYQLLTDSDGAYQVELPHGWSGELSSSENWRLNPERRVYPGIGANRPNDDFAAFRQYFVANNGTDSASGTLAAPFATLDRAFDAVQPGETIYLRGGTYIGDGSGFGRLMPAVSGEVGYPITLTPYQEESVIIDRGLVGSSWTFLDFRQGNSYWNVHDLEIVNFAKGVNIDSGDGPPSHHMTFTNLHIHHCGQPIASEGKAARIRRGAHHIDFRNCEFDHIAGPGVLVADDSHDITFLNCLSHDNDDGRGVDGDADGFTVDDVLTGEGHPENLWPYNVRFLNCTSWNNTEDGFDAKGDNILFDRCKTWNNGANGFKCWAISNSKEEPPVGLQRTRFTVQNCLAYNVGETCIEPIHQPELTILNSTFIATGEAAETFIIPRHKSYDPWEGIIYARNNIFVHLGDSPSTNSQIRALFADVHNWQIDMDYNVFAAPNLPEHTILRRIDGQPGIYYSETQIESGGLFTGEGWGQHARGILPTFVDLAAFDLHLADSDDVARNAGVESAAHPVTRDLDGVDRPQGTAIDRGCYERD